MENDYYEEVKNQNPDNNATPILSVAIIAYNIEAYLEAAILSVLSQKTAFKVEIIIGEDCSTDRTREIALLYQQKYSHIIRVILNKENLGLTPNFIQVQNACSGKYIALLDGDDYWTNPNKLQMQLTFLENHPHFSASAHQSTKIFENGNPSQLFGAETDAIFGLSDTLSHRKFHTSSLVYRNEIWKNSGPIPSNISSNERALYPMLALHGNIKYFKESMCVYRLSGANLSSRINYKELETDLHMLPWLKNLAPDFPILRFRSFLHLCMYTYGSKIPFLPLLRHFFLFTLFSFSYFPKNLGDIKWGFLFFLKRI